MTKILLVDDEPDIVFTSKIILEKEGHQVIVAKNGEECLEMLDDVKPNLILLDVMMPGMDGWETCRKIKKNKKTKDTPVVMFTVRASHDSVKKSKEYAHADFHINKPFKKDELLNVIRKFLKE